MFYHYDNMNKIIKSMKRSRIFITSYLLYLNQSALYTNMLRILLFTSQCKHTWKQIVWQCLASSASGFSTRFKKN